MKKLVTNYLIRRTAKFINKKRPKIVVATGSVGKTSTTQAIATVLKAKYSVLTTKGNYNTDIGVVMTIFGQHSKTNVLAWIWLSLKVCFLSFRKPKHEVYVLELGTDHPGEIATFSFLKPDIAVVTAVAPEHMEFFKTIEAVAEEELSVSKYSQTTLINKRMVADKFLKDLGDIGFYDRSDVLAHAPNLKVVGIHSLDAVAAAAKLAEMLGMNKGEISDAIQQIEPQPGRMNVLKGVNDSVLIDDTYNSSPEAAKAALDYLYSLKAPQKIVLLGNMNELGDTSADSHREIGEYCDPGKLDMVLTLGPDSNNFLAEAAEKRGCKVVRCKTPYEAGDKIKEFIKTGAVVLLKGSQNGVYAEEATKMLLADSNDTSKLVRQTSYWPAKKKASFKVGE